MASEAADKLAQVWSEIQSWPAGKRLSLASRILRSLEKEAEAAQEVASPDQKQALSDLIGIWETDSPPGDDDVKRIMEQERMTKYR